MIIGMQTAEGLHPAHCMELQAHPGNPRLATPIFTAIPTQGRPAGVRT